MDGKYTEKAVLEIVTEDIKKVLPRNMVFQKEPSLYNFIYTRILHIN